MFNENFQKFDAHLSEADFDSQDWNDGLGREVAVELLAKFEIEDWSHLSGKWAKKERLWRGCLVSSLSPDLGEDAQNILISAMKDSDPEVAFLALDLISFYCGINDGSDGPFEDSNILNQEFRVRVLNTNRINEKIHGISKMCAPFLQARFNLLSKVLS
jgi:hypothetical protein